MLKYLHGMYCATDDQDVIDEGLKNVKTILPTTMCAPTKPRR
ncbi:hypothetical protein [Halomonas sp. DQ26W]|nr:hypothetical protein [Halomonas sp. DQ26W]